MKILIINSILYTSETNHIPKVDSIKDTMIYTLCMGFLSLGHTPVLIAAEDYRPTEKEDYPFEIIFLPCKWKKIFHPRCLPWMPSLSRYLHAHQSEFDLIITSEVFSLCSYSAVCIAKEKTVVWHELSKHNRLLKELPSKLWYNLIGRTVFRNAMIAPRSQEARHFISQYCNRVSATCIDHGVDLSLFHADVEKKKQFAIIARLVKGKQINVIIDRFVDFQKRYDSRQEYRLYIVGDGIMKDQLQKQVKDLEAEERISFTGHLSHAEMVEILSRSQAILVNTIKDNNMVSIAESIASGTPVLTNSVPNNARYIKEYSLGIVRDNWNAEDLHQMVNDNRFYSGNCVAYREKLSNTYCAKQFLKLMGLIDE